MLHSPTTVNTHIGYYIYISKQIMLLYSLGVGNQESLLLSTVNWFGRLRKFKLTVVAGTIDMCFFGNLLIRLNTSTTFLILFPLIPQTNHVSTKTCPYKQYAVNWFGRLRKFKLTVVAGTIDMCFFGNLLIRLNTSTTFLILFPLIPQTNHVSTKTCPYKQYAVFGA